MEVEDLTLDELRLALAPGIAEAAVFDGWSNEALDMAADQLGADRDVARQLGGRVDRGAGGNMHLSWESRLRVLTHCGAWGVARWWSPVPAGPREPRWARAGGAGQRRMC